MTRTEGRLDDLAAVGPFFAVETHPPGTGPTAVNLLKEVIASLIAGIEPGHRLAPEVLWGNVASAANKAAAQVAARHPELSRPAWTAAATLFATPWLSRKRQPPGRLLPVQLLPYL